MKILESNSSAIAMYYDVNDRIWYDITGTSENLDIGEFKMRSMNEIKKDILYMLGVENESELDSDDRNTLRKLLSSSLTYNVQTFTDPDAYDIKVCIFSPK